MRKGLFTITIVFILNDGQLEAVPLQRKREIGVYPRKSRLRESGPIFSERWLLWVWVHFQFPRPDGCPIARGANTVQNVSRDPKAVGVQEYEYMARQRQEAFEEAMSTAAQLDKGRGRGSPKTMRVLQ